MFADTVEALWVDTVFGLVSDTCLVVRPGQHVSYRGPLAQAGEALAQLFEQRGHT